MEKGREKEVGRTCLEERERLVLTKRVREEEREGGLNTLESVICVPDEVYKQRPPVGMVQR